MGKKTKIDWCDSTWNPVTGCLHGCAYCYARRIAERFRAKEFSGAYTVNEEENVPRTTYELEEPVKRCCTDAKGLHVYEKAPCFCLPSISNTSRMCFSLHCKNFPYLLHGLHRLALGLFVALPGA